MKATEDRIIGMNFEDLFRPKTFRVRGRLLAEWRKENGILAKNFASKLNISSQYLSDIEVRGKTVPNGLAEKIWKNVIKQEASKKELYDALTHHEKNKP